MRVKGTLKSWHDDKGYGFITSPLYVKDVFVHISAFSDRGHRPGVGESLTFEVENDHNGKIRAVNVRGPSSSAASRDVLHIEKKGASLSKIVIVLAVFGAGFAFYDKLFPQPVSRPANSSGFVEEPALYTPEFKCDGRQYCGQMHSRAEAEFFLKHCPDTKMDGDHDGIPCENDSRF